MYRIIITLFLSFAFAGSAAAQTSTPLSSLDATSQATAATMKNRSQICKADHDPTVFGDLRRITSECMTHCYSTQRFHDRVLLTEQSPENIALLLPRDAKLCDRAFERYEAYKADAAIPVPQKPTVANGTSISEQLGLQVQTQALELDQLYNACLADPSRSEAFCDCTAKSIVNAINRNRTGKSRGGSNRGYSHMDQAFQGTISKCRSLK